MARLRDSWRTSLPASQQPRNPQSESIARTPYQVSLSKVLSVQRQSVIKALQSLEERRAISVKPGQITVLDRANLAAVADDSYGVPEAEYARLFGVPLRRSDAGPNSGRNPHHRGRLREGAKSYVKRIRGTRWSR